LKRKDAFIQILHEVTGMSKELIEKDMANMLSEIPGIDDEMSDAEYEQFLSELRTDGVCL
jgi:hypothetical protein